MAYNCVVLVKQVPDTKRITGKAMNDDGTVNRSALPAIFNPEDLNALEMALEIKDKFARRGEHSRGEPMCSPNSPSVTVITMGLPAAANILREALYRGADNAILITDARAAASDTLATSYILSCAVKRLKYDVVLCGRQAIDGDTAQVGPQLAEKLGIPQITYVEKLIELKDRTIIAQRNIGNGWQKVKAQLPVLLTVIGDANEPRVAAAKKMMKYKATLAPCEIEQRVKAENPHASPDEIKEMVAQKCAELDKKGLLIQQRNLDFLKADLNWCGRTGSPTKVHRIQSVVLAAKDSKTIDPTDQDITDMIHELIDDKIIA